MNTLITPEQDAAAAPNIPAPTQRRATVLFVRLGLVLLVGALLIGGWLLLPIVRWAYDVQQAGQLLDRGLAWPTPRLADSLPQARDLQALDQALPYLADAMRQRPAQPQAYRLAGQIYAARGTWDQAAAAWEQARAVAPRNPLYSWETRLIYQRMQQIIEQAPQQPVLDTIAAGQVTAPGQLIKSLFCNDQGASSCYSGRTTYSQPFAAFPEQKAAKMPVLFLHPPASIERALLIPAELPALRFAVGLDPVARDWASDGASFQVWVQPSAGAPQLAGELSIDRATALRGWVPGWVDLTPWAGQTVTLKLESLAGPAGDLNDDWYGWAALALTTKDAARYAAMLPAQHERALR